MGKQGSRSAVITGGTSGIGRALALRLGREGVRVVVAGRDERRGADVVGQVAALGGSAEFVATDVTADAEVRHLAERASAEGELDLWFSNAGTEGPIGPMSTWDEGALRHVLDVNLLGMLSGLRHAADHLRAGGAVVNTASFVGTAMAVPIAVPYAAAKAGVVAAGRSAAPLLADAGIAVYTLCPWVIDTPMVDRLTGGASDDKAGFAASFAPSGRLTSAEDVAAAAWDLVEGRIAASSGDAFLIDAGPTVTRLQG